MKQIPLTKGKFAIVDDEDYAELSRYSWHCTSSGYARRSFLIGYEEGKKKIGYENMHKRLMGSAPSVVDHINGDSLDNRKCNLRFATIGQNSQNKKRCSNSSSMFKGVGYDKHAKKWKAQIKINNKSIHLGNFATEEEGAKAYNKAALHHFGEFARLNEIV